MTKQQFLMRLRDGLSVLPQAEIDSHIAFYAEMIDDRIEEGYSEEEAVQEIGSVEWIISQILHEASLAPQEDIVPKKRFSGWLLLLLILGSPLWVSLLAAAFAVVLSIYATLWSLVVSAWAIFASFVACALGLCVAGIIFAFSHPATGAGLLGAGLLCAGLGILTFLGCKAATAGAVILTKKIGAWIKRCVSRKGAAA